MPGLLIVAHAPLASALKVAAEHTFLEKAQTIAALDVPAHLPVADIEAQLRVMLQQLIDKDDRHEVLVLTDVFGATPCNVAQRLVDGQTSKIITGCNVPMLWRVLNYLQEPLELLVTRALSGGSHGVMQIGLSRPQNQNITTPHDQDIRDHQQ